MLTAYISGGILHLLGVLVEIVQ